ncbi:hypothetical protein MHF_0529 [Mycoplasma haemofelis Ohio2]|uniref:Uncharacterized protein n=1 Tax=Mycoplasma haemofelis (strain Ohio2) TaxID=859194 RepID=F6FHV3_MYCHI|nr:hypothetical protein MHF_0529 [Mycoplasma haemofelis Ohio2]
MSKLAALILGIAGTAGTAGLGFLIAKNQKDETKKIKNNYPHAILTFSNNEGWNSKFQLLNSKETTHPTLKKAKAQFSNTSQSQELYKKGCNEIYDSEGTQYLDDFKTFCSKTNKDAITGSWISDAASVNTNWDKKLTSLKERNSGLSSEFLEVQSSLGSGSFDETARGKIKKACDDSHSEIYLGPNDIKTQSIKDFCLSEQT